MRGARVVFKVWLVPAHGERGEISKNRIATAASSFR
jgi:hypothetical protein